MDNKEKSYWKEFYPIWMDEVKSWFGWGDRRQTMTSIIVSLSSIYGFIALNNIEIAIENALQIAFAFLATLVWVLIVAIIGFVTGNIKLYKRKTSEIENLTNHKVRAAKISLQEVNKSQTVLIKIHNKESVHFTGYLVAWKINGCELLNPKRLFTISDEDIKPKIVSEISLHRDEYINLGLALAKPKEGIYRLWSVELAKELMLDKKVNTIHTKLFGKIGEYEIIPKDQEWEITILKTGMFDVRKVKQ